ncbi:MAG: Rho termination factor N-terminal domain-containing protein [Nitrososphaerota archaeon]
MTNNRDTKVSDFSDEELENVDVQNNLGSLSADNITYERLQEYSISELRRLASSYYRIRINRDWEKEDIIQAIMKARAKNTYASPAIGDMPPPGRARIRIFADSSGVGSPKSPVYVCVNGYEVLIPREVPVDVPIEVLNVLREARAEIPASIESIDFTNPEAMKSAYFRKELIVYYPLEVIATNPLPGGKGILSVNQRSGKIEKYRERFLEEYGYWPSDQELREFIREVRASEKAERNRQAKSA